MDTDTIKIEADTQALDILETHLVRLGLKGFCALENRNDLAGRILIRGEEERYFDAPVRLGKVLDYIIILSKRSQKKQELILTLGDGTLDITQSLFIQDSKETRLTEKEVEILRCLYDRRGKIISRADLLGAVWGYGQGIETHTLETHIYRLRQKIEVDSSVPKILITEDNGYKLSV